MLPCVAKYTARLDNAVCRYQAAFAINGLAGDAVEVSSGRKLLLAQSETDFTLPGRLPLVCTRFYSSTLEIPGLLGRGWRLPWEITLRKVDGGLVYTDQQGREIRFLWLEAGTQMLDPIEQIYLSRIKDGRFVLHTLEALYYVFDVFDQHGVARLKMIEDALEQRIGFVWNTAGQLLRVRGLCGHELHLRYRDGPQARLIAIDCVMGGSLGRLVSYVYDDQGCLCRVSNRTGQVIRQFTYDAGLLVEHVNALGFSCCTLWQTIDGFPRVVEQRDCEGAHYYFKYDFVSRHTEVCNVFGHSAHWYYDEYGQIVAYSGFDGAAYRFAYNDAGWLVTLHLPGERCVQLDYDALGREMREIDPLGHKTETVYHANTFKPLFVVLDDTRFRRMERDKRGLMLLQTDLMGRTSRYTYSEDGTPLSMIDARGGVTRFEHNRWGCITRCIDVDGKSSHYGYDSNGYLCRIQDALGQVVHIEYSNDGWPHTVNRADGSREYYAWNVLGQLLSYTNAEGHTQYWYRNRRGQVIRYVDCEDRTVSYEYDAHGRLTVITNSNGVSHRFGWDAGDRLQRERLPGGMIRQYTYHATGYLQSIETCAGGQVRRMTYHHDALGRLTAWSSDHSHTVCEYDLLGQVINVSREPTKVGNTLRIVADSVRFEYDRSGWLLAEHGAHGSVHYRRDQLGIPLLVTLPQGQLLSSNADAAGYMQQIAWNGIPIAIFQRDALYREIMRNQGMLITETVYDVLGRRIEQTSVTAAHAESGQIQDILLSRKETYSPVGMLVSSVDRYAGHRYFKYDRSGRLLRCFSDTFHLEHFVWDNIGNLLDDQSANGGQPASSLIDNLLLSYRGWCYEYDVWGQLIRKYGNGPETHYEWDVEGHLLAMHCEGQSAYYHYDALGRRILKQIHVTHGNAGQGDVALDVSAVEETRFVWQGLRLLQEQSKAIISTYLYEPHRWQAHSIPMARIDQVVFNSAEDVDKTVLGAPLIYHYHTDSAGVVREVFDQNGQLAWSGHYTAWGKVVTQVGSLDQIKQVIRMPGRYLDEESGLHYSVLGYVDPNHGRLINPGLFGGLNPYCITPISNGWCDPVKVVACVVPRHCIASEIFSFLPQHNLIAKLPVHRLPYWELLRSIFVLLGEGCGQHDVNMFLKVNEYRLTRTIRQYFGNIPNHFGG